jgi:predicted dehydrogenase
MSRTKVACVGAGGLANSVHYPSVLECADLAELVAICDLDESRLNATADKYGVPARYTDLRAMLAEADLDAVYAIMPPRGLRDVVLQCLEAGKHVFTEKPLGMSADEAREMATAAERAGVKTMVGFNRRFSHVVREARRLVLERGEVTQALVEFHKCMSEPYYDMSICLMDIIHVIDLLRHLCGEVTRVSSNVQQCHDTWNNMFNALLKFEGGAMGMVTADRHSGARYERIEFHGEKIACYVRAPERAEVWRDDGPEPLILTGEELAGTAESRITYGYAGETRHFLESIRDDVLPWTHFGDAARTMELCEVIEQGGF